MITLSVICPVFNEESFIEEVIKFFLAADPQEKELYIIDGGSTDKTTEIVKGYIQVHNNIHLVSNPNRYVPYALNCVIPLCLGEYIVRLDAHTEYDLSYFTEIINTFKNTNASIVGGPMRAVGKTPTQQAVAYATSTPLGVGNSTFHFDTIEGEADSVYLGAWKKDIFEKTGLFDTRFLRNQDDEFHYRAKSLGFKIWLNPRIKSYYFPRSTLKSLWRQYYQYGLFKPLVLRKIKSGMRIRHLIPSFFVLYLLMLPLLYFTIGVIAFAPLGLYFALVLFEVLRAGLSVRSKFFLLLVFPSLHISYGSGFLLGFRKSL